MSLFGFEFTESISTPQKAIDLFHIKIYLPFQGFLFSNLNLRHAFKIESHHIRLEVNLVCVVPS